ncbi:hypothetical protein MC7420_2686 [Coleofasciculus chthonoplastes PCC 7420]|uniref:Uncharacterized protein n=1 Tax=Coleofasciculus chthonoplastes PCC 7420 TaxID=118168 RepID=B4VYA4_9CYAN|nr:hypothetical protein MC7420_2686 [Coleofasciculus chthonoplastes PCC 7420]
MFRDNCRGAFRESIQLVTNNETTKPALPTHPLTPSPIKGEGEQFHNYSAWLTNR